MRFDFFDWSVMATCVTVFVLSLAVAGSLFAGALYFRNDMERRFREHDAAFRAHSSRYLAVDAEKKMIEDYYPQFMALHRGGRIGAERRLDWLETLGRIGAEQKLPALNYAISARRPFLPTFPLDLGGFRLYRSEMTLGMQLAREEELLRLLDRLARRAEGYFRIRECRLRNDTGAGSGDGRVRADCLLEWFTLDRVDGGLGEGGPRRDGPGAPPKVGRRYGPETERGHEAGLPAGPGR